ncbi:MAG: hypothetical protein ABI251_00190, partial [Mycobacteriaceae bacterium]
ANAARHEPQAIAAVRTGGEGRLAKLLRLPAPVSYSAGPVARVVLSGDRSGRLPPERRTAAPRGQTRQPVRGPRRHGQPRGERR